VKYVGSGVMSAGCNFFGFGEAALRRRRKRIEEVAAIIAHVGIEARHH
jgi:hypothetical protein